MDLNTAKGIFVLAMFALAMGLPIHNALRKRRAARLLRQYHEAFERGDADEVERIRDTIERLFPPTGPYKLIGEGEILILRERWAEARDVLEKIKREHLPMINRPGILNNLAYATAHAGDPEKAVELARTALAEAKRQGEKYPATKIVNIRGTLGIALSLAGRHTEAIETLEALKNESGSPRSRAVRAYFLGNSLRGAGRADRARSAYETAAGLDGPWADRARARME